MISINFPFGQQLQLSSSWISFTSLWFLFFSGEVVHNVSLHTAYCGVAERVSATIGEAVEKFRDFGITEEGDSGCVYSERVEDACWSGRSQLLKFLRLKISENLNAKTLKYSSMALSLQSPPPSSEPQLSNPPSRSHKSHKSISAMYTWAKSCKPALGKLQHGKHPSSPAYRTPSKPRQSTRCAQAA